MADDLLTAADKGTIERGECPALLVDYLGPALDTTISAMSTALALFATHPEQWDLLRREPERIPNAINEVVRFESPVRAFGRRVVRDTEITGVRVPAGSQVLIMYASANRDELGGNGRRSSTSRATPGGMSASARARTHARDRRWRGWRQPNSCGR